MIFILISQRSWESPQTHSPQCRQTSEPLHSFNQLADVWKGLEGTPSRFAYLIQALLFIKLNKLIVFTEALL